MTWECMQMLLQNTVLDHSNHTKKFTVQMLTCWQLALGSVKYQCTLLSQLVLWSTQSYGVANLSQTSLQIGE